MNEIIRTRGKLSFPDNTQQTTPIGKVEKESSTRMMVQMTRMIIKVRRLSEDFKGIRILLII
jgi:hypothetical protein